MCSMYVHACLNTDLLIWPKGIWISIEKETKTLINAYFYKMPLTVSCPQNVNDI